MKRRYLKTILYDLNCSENIWKIHRKKSVAFTSASSSKAEPSHRCFSSEFSNYFLEQLLL